MRWRRRNTSRLSVGGQLVLWRSMMYLCIGSHCQATRSRLNFSSIECYLFVFQEHLTLLMAFATRTFWRGTVNFSLSVCRVQHQPDCSATLIYLAATPVRSRQIRVATVRKVLTMAVRRVPLETMRHPIRFPLRRLEPPIAWKAMLRISGGEFESQCSFKPSCG